MIKKKKEEMDLEQFFLEEMLNGLEEDQVYAAS